MRRTKKDRLPPRADERDRALSRRSTFEAWLSRCNYLECVSQHRLTAAVFERPVRGMPVEAVGPVRFNRAKVCRAPGIRLRRSRFDYSSTSRTGTFFNL